MGTEIADFNPAFAWKDRQNPRKTSAKTACIWAANINWAPAYETRLLTTQPQLSDKSKKRNME
jgi:hypothetical protein